MMLVEPEDLPKMRIAEPDCREPHGLPLNPFRTRIWMAPDGTWSARYRSGWSGGCLSEWEITGCDSQVDASVDLRHFVRQKVAHIDGEFVEVVRR